MATIKGTPRPDQLVGTAGDDNIRGYAGDDVLTGLGGNDFLDGDTGTDRLVGGTGNDLYVVDTAADVVIENAGEGFDRVLATADYTLAAGQEIEELTTRSSLDTANINLTGNEFANILFGDVGDNILDGGAGADSLYGRGGNDTYRVDNVKDRVIENAHEGNDTVIASVSYILTPGQEIETLETSARTARNMRINLTGNAFDNTLIGNDSDNVLNGGAGADIMMGGLGSDTFYVDNLGDQVIAPTSNASGGDRVFTSVDFTVADGQPIGIVSATDIHSTNPINLSGNSFANLLIGNDGDNRLSGGKGMILSREMAVPITFVANAPNGTSHIADFVAITDFANSTNAVHDTFFMPEQLYPMLHPGPLDPSQFYAGRNDMAPPEAKLIYDITAGELDMRTSTTDLTQLTTIALFSNKPTITPADIFVG